MGQFCRRCNPKQRGPYPNIRANEHKWRPIGSNENMPWVVVTIPDELEKNGQPQNEKMKFESSEQGTKLSMKLTAQVQARIRDPQRSAVGEAYHENRRHHRHHHGQTARAEGHRSIWVAVAARGERISTRVRSSEGGVPSLFARGSGREGDFFCCPARAEMGLRG